MMQSTDRDEVPRREAALQKAMLAFWRDSVAATSYPELVDATGLSRKALYGYWPDKDALVLDALTLYDTSVLAPMRDALLPPSVQTLRAFWEGFENAIHSPGWNGCLLLRSASNELRNDTVTRQHLLRHMDCLRDRISDCIAAGQATSDIDKSIKPTAAANHVVGLLAWLSLVGGLEGFAQRASHILAEAKTASGIN